MLIAYLAALSQAAPSEPQPVWQVNQRERFCVVVRERTAERPGILLQAYPFSPFNTLVFMVPKIGAHTGNASVDLSVPSQRSAAPSYASIFEPAKSADRLLKTSIDEDQLAAAAAQGSLGITVAKRENHVLPLRGFGKVISALKACEERVAAALGLAKTWSQDPIERDDFRGMVQAEDYPVEMVSAGEQASISLLLKIDAQGRIEDCRAYELQGDRRWEKVVCPLLRKRAKITPARDFAGRSVSSYMLTPTIHFVIG